MEPGESQRDIPSEVCPFFFNSISMPRPHILGYCALSLNITEDCVLEEISCKCKLDDIYDQQIILYFK